MIGSSPAPEVIELYTRAIQLPALHASSAALRLARRIPALLGPCEAACALMRPDDVLRRRLLMLAAILETHPRHARHFLSRPQSRSQIIWTMVKAQWRGAFKAAVGIVLLAPAGYWRRRVNAP